MDSTFNCFNYSQNIEQLKYIITKTYNTKSILKFLVLTQYTKLIWVKSKAL